MVISFWGCKSRKKIIPCHVTGYFFQFSFTNIQDQEVEETSLPKKGKKKPAG
jgi:hypothetical protein